MFLYTGFKGTTQIRLLFQTEQHLVWKFWIDICGSTIPDLSFWIIDDITCNSILSYHHALSHHLYPFCHVLYILFCLCVKVGYI